MRHTFFIQNNEEPEEDLGPSKSQRKAEMLALHEIGKQLIDLPDERLKRVPLPERLRDAVLEAKRLTAHEARRRQTAYVGKVMREVEVEPIIAALAAFEKVSSTVKAHQHRLEKLRTDLLANENLITQLAQTYPHANLQLLRQLRRNALKEKEAAKPPRAYRALFQELKALVEGKATPVSPDFDAIDSEDATSE